MIFTLISLSGCSPTNNEAHIKKPSAEPTKTPTINNPKSRVSAERPDTRSTPTSQPAINGDWDDLPELPTAEPSLVIDTVTEPTPTPGQPETSPPQTTFPSLPIPNAIWSAGILNGSPASGDAEFSQDEYGPSDQTDPILRITDPKDLPAFLLPQQKVVIHLPGFQPALYTVHVATTGGSDKTREKLKEKDRRRLIVRWNDHLLWRRWLAPIHSICSTVVPPQNVSKNTNQLILENWGTLPLPLDSVWISLYSRGEYPFYVAMMQGEWLNQDESKWIRTVVLELSPPSGDFDLSTLPKRISQAPPQTPLELSMRWKEALARYHSLIQSDPKAAEALQPWMHDFSQAVSRGIMPAVSLLPPDHPNGSKGIALIMYLFGDLVHTWFLGGSSTDKLWEERIQSLAPVAKVVSRDPDNPTDQPWLRYQSASYDFQKQFYQGRQRKAFFEGGLSESEFKKRCRFLLNTHVNFIAYMWNQQCFNSFVLHRWVTGNLMENDYPVVVHGGHPGGPFFPAGNDSPGLMWEYLKTIFRFGGPDFRKGLANLTGTDNQPELLGATWAVADNGRDSVQVVVNSFPLLHGRDVLLELPLPWNGPTSVLHHHVESYWRPPKESPPETTSAKLTIEGEMIPLDEEGTKGSWVKIPFTLQGHHMFEFRKEGSTENRPLSAPVQVGAAELKNLDRLFEISKFAPPPWWSRMPMGGHSSISWNQSGNVEMNVNVPASKTTVPDWAVFKDIHGSIAAEVKAVTPLRDTSTRFYFGEQPGKLAQVVCQFKSEVQFLKKRHLWFCQSPFPFLSRALLPPVSFNAPLHGTRPRRGSPKG